MYQSAMFFIVACIVRNVCAAGLEPRITPAPDARFASDLKFRLGIQKRDDIFARSNSPATCGYITENLDNPITCGAGDGCIFWPALPIYRTDYNLTLRTGAVDCCPYSGTTKSYHFSECLPPTACLNYNSASSSLVPPAGTIVCPSSSPSCATFVFIGAPSIFASGSLGSSEQAEIYTALYCSDVRTEVKVFPTYTNSPSKTSQPAPSSSSSSSPSSTTTKAPSSSSSTSVPASNGGSSTSTGAIAGAAVGGFVGVAAIAAGLGYLIWRRTRARPPESPEISQYPY